jgi:TPR repeat protein
MTARLAAVLVALLLGGAGAAAQQPISVRPAGAPLAPRLDADIAYGTFQRGLYITAFAEATEAAANGDGAAMTLIGMLYSNGFGVPRSPARAAEWYALATVYGDVRAMVALAGQLAAGSGIERPFSCAGRPRGATPRRASASASACSKARTAPGG